jgi:hypothetical protein
MVELATVLKRKQMHPSPFQRILGTAFEQLPAAVRRVHGLSEATTTSGLAEITAAPGLPAWLICRIAGLPRPGRDIPVTVSFHPDGRGREHWKRRFGARRYASTMSACENGADLLLAERLGLFELHHRLTPLAGGLGWSLVRWRLMKIPLPACTLPAIKCMESGDHERFFFDIDVVFPIVGPVIHYRGWLDPAADA